ncbi:DUF7344 domain-containing protein [Haladaptatus halobius]|uniref:DUF7344 domain-containing protein n=1 Tax=Haladaptatus halobius TaxID=2884875 RepID=UPI003F62E6C7
MTISPNDDPTSTQRRSLETVFKLLADAQRRALLRYFTDEDTDSAELAELVDHVHEEVDNVTAPRQTRIALIHIHLPKLAEHDIIEYDQREHTVHYWGGTNLEALLGVATRLEATV